MRNNVLTTHNGKTLCVSEWVREVGMSVPALYNRLRRGWDFQKATVPPVARSGGVACPH